jgi:cytochrome c553
MMSKRTVRLALLAAALAFAAGEARAQGDASRGQQKAGDCGACHGPAGNTVVPEWPKIAGLSEAYVVAQLRAYQTGGRRSVLMAPAVRALTEGDMHDIGAYYAAQRITAASRPLDDGLVAAGERIYRGGVASRRVTACMVCHGPAGEGHAAVGFTRLGGQHAAYVAAEMEGYRDGRRADPTGMMQKIAAAMSDDEIRAVASYIAGLVQR